MLVFIGHFRQVFKVYMQEAGVVALEAGDRLTLRGIAFKRPQHGFEIRHAVALQGATKCRARERGKDEFSNHDEEVINR